MTIAKSNLGALVHYRHKILLMSILCLFFLSVYNYWVTSKIVTSSITMKDLKDLKAEKSTGNVGRVLFYTGLFSGLISSWLITTHDVGFKNYRALWSIYSIMVIWMFFHSVIAYWDDPPGLSELHGTKGILVWVFCIVLFVSMSSQAWKLVARSFSILTYVACVIALLNLFKNRSGFLTEGQSHGYSMGLFPLLTWFAILPIMMYTSPRSSFGTILIGLVPLLVLTLCAFYNMGRSWIIISSFYWSLVFVRYGRAFLKKAAVICCLIVVCISIVMILIFVFKDSLNNTIFFLSETWNLDTRSEQYIEFFSQVSPEELIVGKGPRGTYYWGRRDYAYIDGIFISLAFNGGLPLLLCYILLIIVPAFRLLARRPAWRDAAPALILIMWTLAMCGISTFTAPRVSYEHLIICMFAGRCHFLLRTKYRRSRIAPSRSYNNILH